MHDVYQQVAHELSDANLTELSQLRLKVTSRSMTPNLRPGDFVLVQSIPLETYQRGDLLVTRREDSYLTHRLVAVDSSGWHTKGDRNPRTDAPIKAQSIVGLVIAVERQGKTRYIHTRSHRFLARLIGWLGWQETSCNTFIGSWLAKMMSRILQVLTH
jgi:signal peptidase I